MILIFIQPLDRAMKNFIKVNGLINLIKGNACFKGQGSCIDLNLTNRRFSFKHSNSYETGLSDHHHFIYSMLKSNLSNSEPKLVNCKDCKRFSFKNFKTSLDNSLRHCSTDCKHFENISMLFLNECAPQKKKVIWGNHKPHQNKELGKAIMLRSKLKNKANKTKIDVDIAAYKKQRNYVVALNQKSKYNYFNNLDVSKGVKPFWKTCKPYFSNKHSRGDTSIILIEKNELILNNRKIATTFKD